MNNLLNNKWITVIITKLQVAPVELDVSSQSSQSLEPVELVVSSESSCAVRLARHSQNAWARHVECVESSRAKWNLSFTSSSLYVLSCVQLSTTIKLLFTDTCTCADTVGPRAFHLLQWADLVAYGTQRFIYNYTPLPTPYCGRACTISPNSERPNTHCPSFRLVDLGSRHSDVIESLLSPNQNIPQKNSAVMVAILLSLTLREPSFFRWSR